MFWLILRVRLKSSPGQHLATSSQKHSWVLYYSDLRICVLPLDYCTCIYYRTCLKQLQTCLYGLPVPTKLPVTIDVTRKEYWWPKWSSILRKNSQTCLLACHGIIIVSISFSVLTVCNLRSTDGTWQVNVSRVKLIVKYEFKTTSRKAPSPKSSPILNYGGWLSKILLCILPVIIYLS